MFKRFLLYFSVWKLLILILAAIAALFVPIVWDYVTDRQFAKNFHYLVWIWGNFDGYHYMHIAREGYGLFEYPFFPFFPFLIKILREGFAVPTLIAGQLISNTAFFLSFFVISKIATLDKKRNLLLAIFLLIFLFPTSFFYGAVYNDSLFFLFSLLTIYEGRRRNWQWAGVYGFFATLTRLNGLALFFYILAEYIWDEGEIRGWNFKKVIETAKTVFSLKLIRETKIYFCLLIPLAFLGYLLFTQITAGDWNLIFSSMKGWNQDRMTFPPQVFWRYFKILVLYHSFNITYLVAAIELLFVLFYIFILFFSFKKIRFSYWVFMALSFLIPSLTGTFQGMPRYALHLYPFFLSVALFLEEKRKVVKIAYFTISLLLLFLCLALFTRGYFIA